MVVVARCSNYLLTLKRRLGDNWNNEEQRAYEAYLHSRQNAVEPSRLVR